VAIAAVVGVRVVLESVGVVAIEAVVGVAVVPPVVASAGAAVAPVVAPTVAAAVPVAPTALRKAASSAVEPPMTTGVGAELMDAFTVACGLA